MPYSKKNNAVYVFWANIDTMVIIFVYWKYIRNKFLSLFLKEHSTSTTEDPIEDGKNSLLHISLIAKEYAMNPLKTKIDKNLKHQ